MMNWGLCCQRKIFLKMKSISWIRKIMPWKIQCWHLWKKFLKIFINLTLVIFTIIVSLISSHLKAWLHKFLYLHIFAFSFCYYSWTYYVLIWCNFFLVSMTLLHICNYWISICVCMSVLLLFILITQM